MLKIKLLFLLLSFHLFSLGQVSDNPELEADVKISFNYIDQFNENGDIQNIEDLEKHTKEIIEKYDLDCEQTARVYQKLGTIYWYQGTNFDKINALLRDSTLLKWKDCDIVKPNVLWQPSFFLLRSFIYGNRLYDAKQIFNIISTTSNIQDSIPMDWVMDFYKYAGIMYSRMGDEVMALQNFKKALHILNNNDVGIYAIDVHSSYALSLSDFNRFDESEQQFLLAKKVPKENADKATLALNYSNIYIKQKKYDQALVQLMEVSDIVDTLSQISLKSFHFKQLAKCYIGLNRFDEANVALDSAILINGKLNDKSEKSRILGLKGTLQSNLNDFEGVDKYYSEAITLQIPETKTYQIFDTETDLYKKPILNEEYLLLILKDLLEIYSSRFKVTLEEGDLKKVLKIIDELDEFNSRSRSDFSSEYSQLGQVKNSYFIYEKGITACIAFYHSSEDEKYLQKAFELSAKNKSRVLASLQNTRKIYDKLLPSDLRIKIEKLESEKRDLESVLFGSLNESKDSLNGQYLNLITKIKKLKNEISEGYPEIAKRIKEDKAYFSFDELQSYIPKNAHLVDVFFGDENIYIFNVSRNEIQVDLVHNTKDIQMQIDQLYSWTKQYYDEEEYFDTSQKVFESVYKYTFLALDATGCKSIFVMSDGPLHNIPLEAFWMGNQYVVENYDISYFYSLDQLIQTQKNIDISDSYTGFGTNYSSTLNGNLNGKHGLTSVSLPNLEYSEKEISENVQFFKGDSFLGEDASKFNFLQTASKEENIIHTALHGLILDQSMSAIIFDNREEDFLLTSNEVYELRLKNKLTILSACYSASGKVYDGEGARSLARSFLYAGSENIISSLWAASDQANNKIMSTFLAKIKSGKSLQSALTIAKREYLKTVSPAYRHPSYWANMVLVGSSKESANVSLSTGILLGSIVFMAVIFFLLFRSQIISRKRQ